MDNQTLIIGLFAWAAKEVYQTFIGSRKKTQESIQKTELAIAVIHAEIGQLKEGLELILKDRLRNGRSNSQGNRR